MIKLTLPQHLKPLLYYVSLAMIVILTIMSYWLANVASSQSENTHNIGLYTIIQYSVMAIFMLLAWYSSPSSTHLRHYRYMLLVAIIVRILLIGAEPYTSNDVDRYLFDGRMAFEGIDPYSVSHDNASLTELREQWQPPAEHAKYVTLYPPLALTLFSLSASAGIEYALWIWKFLVLIASISTVIVTGLILKKAKKLKHFSLVALSPLLILEAGIGLHIDTFSTLAITLAIYAWQRQKLVLCGVMIGLGTLIKMLPIMLLLPLFFISKKFTNMLTLTLNTFITIVTGYGLLFALGFTPIGSISVFFQKWRNASPLFELFDNYLSTTQIITTLLLIIVVTFISITAVCFFIQKGKQSVMTAKLALCLQAAVTLPLIISPVLFPWYLMPLVPLVALKPNIYLISWLILMPFTYEVLNSFICCGLWQPATWPTQLLGILYLLTLTKLTLLVLKKIKQHFNDVKSSKKLSLHRS